MTGGLGQSRVTIQYAKHGDDCTTDACVCGAWPQGADASARLAHMVETLRLRTAALHRVSRSNDLLRRENDDLRARLTEVRAVADLWCIDSHNEYTAALYDSGPWRFACDLRAAIDGTP